MSPSISGASPRSWRWYLDRRSKWACIKSASRTATRHSRQTRRALRHFIGEHRLIDAWTGSRRFEIILQQKGTTTTTDASIAGTGKGNVISSVASKIVHITVPHTITGPNMHTHPGPAPDAGTPPSESSPPPPEPSTPDQSPPPPNPGSPNPGPPNPNPPPLQNVCNSPDLYQLQNATM